MSDSKSEFTVTPKQISTDEYTYTPSITSEESEQIKVSLSISHEETENMLLAEDVEVTLVDSEGSEFSSSNKSTGELVQVGGSLGVTSSYEIDFDLDDRTPTSLIVKHVGTTSTFEVKEK